MEEKEVRIPILGVIDVDKLEHYDDIHLFKTYTHGTGTYLIKQANMYIALRNVYRSKSRDKEGNDYAIWNELTLHSPVAIDDIKKEQETQLKEAVEPLNNKLLEINETVNALRDSFNSLHNLLREDYVRRLQALAIVSNTKV